MIDADLRKATEMLAHLRPAEEGPTVLEALHDRYPNIRGQDVIWKTELVDRVYGEVHLTAWVPTEPPVEYIFIARLADQKLFYGNDTAKELFDALKPESASTPSAQVETTLE